MKYDYLIVGSGLFGSIFAYEMSKINKKCLVIEKRDHIGGNIYTEKIENINVHKYGPHIFHTNKKNIWDYINQFANFNNYNLNTIANYKGELYNLPFNMNTFYKIWNTKSPEEAKKIIKKQKEESHIKNPSNLEEQAISLVGNDIYNILIKGYTEKQWGKSCSELPSFIIKRLPVRFTFNNNYFNDNFQGIPIGGYTQIIDKMLKKVEVKLNTNFFDDRTKWENCANKILFTGMIDEFYNYCFGELEYRSLRFKTETKNSNNFQGSAIVNYTDEKIPYTRIIEHKHFEDNVSEKTVITKEYPINWEKGIDAYYPINDKINNKLYEKYLNLANKEEKIIFGGRLATYKYYDMWQIIEESLKLVEKELNL